LSENIPLFGRILMFRSVLILFLSGVGLSACTVQSAMSDGTIDEPITITVWAQNCVDAMTMCRGDILYYSPTDTGTLLGAHNQSDVRQALETILSDDSIERIDRVLLFAKADSEAYKAAVDEALKTTGSS
jgi:hypothetical protein